MTGVWTTNSVLGSSRSNGEGWTRGWSGVGRQTYRSGWVSSGGNQQVGPRFRCKKFSWRRVVRRTKDDRGDFSRPTGVPLTGPGQVPGFPWRHEERRGLGRKVCKEDARCRRTWCDEREKGRKGVGVGSLESSEEVHAKRSQWRTGVGYLETRKGRSVCRVTRRCVGLPPIKRNVATK